MCERSDCCQLRLNKTWHQYRDTEKALPLIYTALCQEASSEIPGLRLWLSKSPAALVCSFETLPLGRFGRLRKGTLSMSILATVVLLSVLSGEDTHSTDPRALWERCEASGAAAGRASPTWQHRSLLKRALLPHLCGPVTGAYCKVAEQSEQSWPQKRQRPRSRSSTSAPNIQR